MKIRQLVFLPLCCVILFMSCIKDESLNCECDIESAWVEGEIYSACFYQASQMRKENISSTDNEITFTVKSILSLPDSIPVNFTVTEGAVIEPESGSFQNFKSGPVSYTVTSEDGKWNRKYTVSFKEFSVLPSTFSFEHAEVVVSSNGNNSYHEFYELDQSGNRLSIWASGNQGAVLIKQDTTSENQPTYQAESGYKNKCLCLTTQSAGAFGEMFGKPIAAGNLFLGSFLFEKVLSNPLKATRFGIPVIKAPFRITGWYKYKPGATFTNAKMEAVDGKIDEASIYAVFFRNKDENGNDVYLYGDDVMTSKYVVRKAEVETIPPSDQWAQFEMFFDEGVVDSEILMNQGYSLTVVFSSSKGGATFEGAVGSTLYIDEVEVFYEKN